MKSWQLVRFTYATNVPDVVPALSLHVNTRLREMHTTCVCRAAELKLSVVKEERHRESGLRPSAGIPATTDYARFNKVRAREVLSNQVRGALQFLEGDALSAQILFACW